MSTFMKVVMSILGVIAVIFMGTIIFILYHQNYYNWRIVDNYNSKKEKFNEISNLVKKKGNISILFSLTGNKIYYQSEDWKNEDIQLLSELMDDINCLFIKNNLNMYNGKFMTEIVFASPFLTRSYLYFIVTDSVTEKEILQWDSDIGEVHQLAPLVWWGRE